MKFLIVFFLLSSVYKINAQDIECPEPKIIGDFNENAYQIIYPFGWSESGNFAYIIQDLNEKESVDYAFKVVVQNMKTDSIVWHKNIIFNNEDQLNIKWECDCDLSIDSDVDYMKKYNYSFLKKILWPKHKNEIGKALENNNIIVNPLALMQLTDLSRNNIVIEEVESKYDDYCVDKYEIILKESKDVKKTVFSYQSPKKENPCGISNEIWYRDFNVEAYFKSPFEDRIAIVIFEITNGYEETFERQFLVGAKF